MFWLVHSDLHECKASAALEYMSSMVATLEPGTHSSDGHGQNSQGGKFNVRFKRRNGRVKVTVSSLSLSLSLSLCAATVYVGGGPQKFLVISLIFKHLF